jgi:hypothetical protein
LPLFLFSWLASNSRVWCERLAFSSWIVSTQILRQAISATFDLDDQAL